MFIRTAALTTLLALTGLGAASAQAVYFGVETDAETLGYPGCYNSTSYLPNATFVSSVADPAAATLTSPYYGSMIADVGAAAEAQQPVLHAKADAHSESINATPGFYGSAPYGYGYAHSFDRVTVRSGSLPKGTPVTIVFGNQVDLNTWTYTGLYDGYIDMYLQIGAGTAHSRWTASYLYGVTTSEAPRITVQTTVGSQFSIDGKLRAQAKVFYVDGRRFGGDIHADATARIVVLDIPAGVTLESVSGTVYPVVPAN
ncbi:MAG: hypothetical protein ACJ76N_29630 [Thermoanaerobaculia bacterium]